MPKAGDDAGGNAGGGRKGRPSREDREIEKQVKQALQSVDKQYRTRRGKQVEALLAQVETRDPGAIERLMQEAKRSEPPKKVGTEKVYSGKGRSFDKTFADAYWRSLPKPWKCAHPQCGREIAPRDRSIDHKVPWAVIKLGIETVEVCFGGRHWEVVTTKAMREAYQDVNNLQPMHMSCNSGKNGPKTTDAIVPRPIGNCPGAELCTTAKGS